MHNGGDMIARKMTKFERRTFEIWKFWKGNYPIFSFRLRFFFLVNYACFIILYISTVPFVYLYFSVLKKKKECSIRSNFYQFRIRCNSLGSFQLNTYFIFLVYHLHPEQRLLPFRPFISHSIPLSSSLSSSKDCRFVPQGMNSFKIIVDERKVSGGPPNRLPF